MKRNRSQKRKFSMNMINVWISAEIRWKIGVWYDSNKRRMGKTQMVLRDRERTIKYILNSITKKLEGMYYSSFHGILRDRLIGMSGRM